MNKAIFITLIIGLVQLAALGQADIHSVDFKNFSYEPMCAGESATKIRVRNGKYSKETPQDGYTDRTYFDVLAVEYGDLTGDGKEEAVILSNCNTGGTGQFTEGFVYTLRNSRPALLGRVPGGDRADGGLRSIKVDGGSLVVEFNDPDQAAGACCPEGIVIKKYHISSGGKLVEVGVAIKRALYTKERIAFARGATGKTWSVTIPPRDRKRLLLGARSAQTLSVSYTGGGDVDLRLLEDSYAEVTQGPHKLDAVLKRSGDFTIELSNYSEKPVTVTLTIRIR
jgi:hypothetical protein